MKAHDHEEADTLLVLQAIDVANRYPFTEVVVFSPDTDVFLLLVHLLRCSTTDKYDTFSLLP